MFWNVFLRRTQHFQVHPSLTTPAWRPAAVTWLLMSSPEAVVPGLLSVGLAACQKLSASSGRFPVIGQCCRKVMRLWCLELCSHNLHKGGVFAITL